MPCGCGGPLLDVLAVARLVGVVVWLLFEQTTTQGVTMNSRAQARCNVRRVSATAVIAVGAVAVMAQAPSVQKSKEAWPDMPTYDIFTREELERDFVTLRFAKPLDRPELGFSIMAPTTWDEVPLTISKEEAAHDDQGMVSLALLAGKDKRLRIEVVYCRVPRAMELEKWARAYLDGNGLKLVHTQTAEFSGRQVFDTLVGMQGFLVRMTFSRHGDRIYLVSGSAPEALYRTWARHLGVAAVSFRTLQWPASGGRDSQAALRNGGVGCGNGLKRR